MAAEPSEIEDDALATSEAEEAAPKRAKRARRRWYRLWRAPKPKLTGWRKWVRRLGYTLLLAGIAVLLYVAYELWGTSFWTHRAQNRLRQEFRQQVSSATPPSTLPPNGAPTPTTEPPPPADARLLPPEGSALARLIINKIDLDVIVVEGVEPGNLRDGPGHYPGTPLPGEDGNFVMSGHRTTYGAPFHNLDAMAPGDDMVVQTAKGEFRYRVEWIKVVAPTEIGVTVSTPGTHEITLTTCHPKFSASERLVVRGVQVGDVQPVSIS